MMKENAFNPVGPSKAISLTTSAATGVGISPADNKFAGQYRIANAGSVGCFYSFSAVDAATATANAVIPTGTAASSYYLPAGGIEIISAPIGSILYFSGITASGTATLYVCAGVGI